MGDQIGCRSAWISPSSCLHATFQGVVLEQVLGAAAEAILGEEDRQRLALDFA